MGRARFILTVLQGNLIDVKYCRSESYNNSSNMSGKYKGVLQRIEHLSNYAEFCQCFVHSLNLVESCAVMASTAAANFFLMIQNLIFSSSVYPWEKLEDQEHRYETQASCCQLPNRYPLFYKIRHSLRGTPWTQ